VRIRPIASSSKGNAYVVEHDGFALLVDCGVPRKLLDGYPIEAVLVTHNHWDHVSGLKAFISRRDTAVYANATTAEAVATAYDIGMSSFSCFENGQSFVIGPFEISPFSVPHDAADPVGYLIRAGGETYFHGTDIGSPLDSIGVKLSEATVATLEANHDRELLRLSARPECLKRRIAGPRGHLSNEEAAELVRRFATPRLKKIFLAHLSGECNEPTLALEAVRAALAEAGRSGVEVEAIG